MVSFFWSTPTWDLTRSNKVQVLDPTDVGCNGSHLTMMIVTLIFNLAVLFHVTLLALSALGVLVTLINSNLVRRTYNVPAWLVCMVQGRAGSFLCTGSSNSLVNTFPEKILFDTSLYLMETTITRNRNFSCSSWSSLNGSRLTMYLIDSGWLSTIKILSNARRIL